MKKITLTLILAACTGLAAFSQDLDGFANPPREAYPRVWWHWMDGNISNDGIRKDLEWMHRSGIAGFHQFDAGGSVMQGHSPIVKRRPYLSDAWKESFSYAIRLADSLGMEVGVASAPGWSSTGGPWVQPADAMKKLTWRTFECTGTGRPMQFRLPEPYRTIGKFLNADAGIYAPVFEKIDPWYEDIAVVAVRLPDAEKSLAQLGAVVSSSGGAFTIEQLSNGDIADGKELAINPSGTHAWLQYSFPQPVTIRSMTLAGGQEQGIFDATRHWDNSLQCSQDGKEWKEVCRIPSSFMPRVTISLPETTARYFRILVVNPQPDYSLADYGVPVVMPTGTKIHEWVLHTVYKVNHAEEKAGFATPIDLGTYATPASDAPIQEVRDLTALVGEDGSFSWEVPAGRWRIYRFGASLTGKQNHPAPEEATGLEVDKLDPDAWSRYFHTYLDMYKEASGGLLGQRGIQYLMIDSYEADYMTWTPRMEAAFRQARGYELRTWLPALAGEILGSTKQTEGFLFDWRETLGELFAANYDRVNQLAAEYGMKGRYTESHENGRTFVGDGMDPKRSATVPMAAIWTEDSGPFVSYQADIRESASVAHIYGQNIVAGESFTTNGLLGNAYGWYPGNLKKVADVAMLSGLNRFFIHESAHQPSDAHKPGLGLLFFGQWFNRHDTWAPYAKYWMDYLARSCYMLQAGRNVADVLWYYGEDTNITALYAKALPDVPDGYSYDFASPHALLHRISARDYPVIVLGEHTQNMSLEILAKLHQLVSEGVFLIGKEPVSMAGLGGDAPEFIRLVADIWHTRRPNVFTGSVAEGLQRSGIAPDFQSSVPGVRFVHRKDGNRNIYWVRNFSDAAVDTELTLRDAEGPWRILNPETGRGLNRALNGHTLHLEPNQALFVVATPDALPLPEEKPLQSVATLRLDGAWSVSFDGPGAPDGVQKWNRLTSWTESSDPALKYFSGIATYKNTFTVKKKTLPATLQIDLGQVGQMADVFINGEHVAFLWKAPYKVEWNGPLRPGKNTIEIKVVNLWVNRLIGDAQPDAKKQAFTLVTFYQADSDLLPSGLMGPVAIGLCK